MDWEKYLLALPGVIALGIHIKQYFNKSRDEQPIIAMKFIEWYTPEWAALQLTVTNRLDSELTITTVEALAKGEEVIAYHPRFAYFETRPAPAPAAFLSLDWDVKPVRESGESEVEMLLVRMVRSNLVNKAPRLRISLSSADKRFRGSSRTLKTSAVIPIPNVSREKAESK